ncbi:transposase [Methylomonas sp. MS20]|uniref:transposase n=1 Tax=unclassified Methylomonas TaxID=2608980 RepID=UPI0028A4B5A6|nr:transposase [Methylomonas sp. MV1]MDT4328722.1 transposase [Methylomonas sp. MV1]
MNNLKNHHRKSIRLLGYDYSQAGLYFITLCTHDRLPLFGSIVERAMIFSEVGKIAQEEWQKTNTIRSHIVLHEFVIMPNHFHAIVETVGAHCMRPDSPDIEQTKQERVQRAPTLGDVVRGYKSAVTKRVRNLNGLPDFKIWQRNYYEHIIRNETAYLKIAEYIQTNPQRWLEDTYYV